VLPLLLRHLEIDPGRITILTRGRGGRAQAEAQGVAFHTETVTPDNIEDLLARHLKAGDFLLNLSYPIFNTNPNNPLINIKLRKTFPWSVTTCGV